MIKRTSEFAIEYISYISIYLSKNAKFEKSL